MSRTVVLAYSGGLDTSVCVRWLAQRGYRVVAFMADVGQNEPVAPLIRRAKVAGAAEVVVRDLREEFAREYVLPALQAHAVYEDKYLLATALSRPLIAKHLVDVAHAKRATAIGHGCTGKGNDQVRFEVTVRALDPALEIVAPVREWEFRSREEEAAYAHQHGIPISATGKSPYSIDQNLWGVSVEAGALEDPWQEPPEDSFQWLRPPSRTPDRATLLTVTFERGVPTRVNGRSMPLVRLIQELGRRGSLHGVGRTDVIESRVVGIKSREIYEAPSARILLEAHADLERLVLDRELLHFKQAVALKYAELVYYGLWFTPLKTALDAFVTATQPRVGGSVRLKLFKGNCQVVGRRSPHALYQRRLATYGARDTFDQRLAHGFIKLWGLAYEGRGEGRVKSGKWKVESGNKKKAEEGDGIRKNRTS
ncbi:MAG: argininosuccinate synthase [Candidatus Omnitrophica bacterium]|nr:argininosuccinate synthase [Candidatus Omnitrophota bacterium]